jgi:glutathione S-transferase
MFGLCHEICGENGLGWSRRLMLTDALLGPDMPEAARRSGEVLGARYGYSKAAAEAAPARVAALLTMLAERLRYQKKAGRDFLVGDGLTAADLYWSTFAGLVCPLPAELCPIPDLLRGWYVQVGPVVAAAASDVPPANPSRRKADAHRPHQAPVLQPVCAWQSRRSVPC